MFGINKLMRDISSIKAICFDMDKRITHMLDMMDLHKKMLDDLKKAFEEIKEKDESKKRAAKKK